MVVLWFSGSFVGQRQLRAAQPSCLIVILYAWPVCVLSLCCMDRCSLHTGHNVLPEGEVLLESPRPLRHLWNTAV